MSKRSDSKEPEFTNRVMAPLRRHLYILPSIVAVTLVFVWFATWGTWRLFETEDAHWSFADRFFNAQAMSIQAGRLDVPDDTIEFEAFVHDGKNFGYFGIATSLMRLPLLWVFPNSGENWNRFIATMACVTNLVCAYLILLTIRPLYFPDRKWRTGEKLANSLFIWVVGLGSTNIYLGSRTFMYHEPIIWGGAFASLFYLLFLKYLSRPKTTTLAIALCFGVAALLTRAPQGAGVIACLGLFIAVTSITSALSALAMRGGWRWMDGFCTPKGRHAIWHIALAAFGCVAAVTSYSLVNYAKLGTFSGMPLNIYKRYAVFNEWATYERIEGKPFHLSNAPMLIYDYTSPTKIRFTGDFPWVYVATADDAEWARFPEAKLDFASEFSGFPASKPALVFLAVFGVASATFVRRDDPRTVLRLPLIGAAVGGSFIFLFINIAERYAHDFFPFLVIAGAAGLQCLAGLKSTGLRIIFFMALSLLSLYSIYVNTAFALVHQRQVSQAYGNPIFEEKAKEFDDWRKAIDGRVRSMTRQ